MGRTLGVPLPVLTHAELFSTRTRAFSKNRSKPLLQGCVDTYALILMAPCSLSSVKQRERVSGVVPSNFANSALGIDNFQ